MEQIVNRRWPLSGLAFGGDYNPEQWPETVWAEDMELMAEAGVTMVSLGVFAWSSYEPQPGRFDFSWLDRSMDLLHSTGIAVNLATPTAAPPMWLLREHPEIATVSPTGVRTGRGGRLAWSPSSPVFREHALSMVRALAAHVAGHPALAMWHVGNEFGNENADCFSDDTEAAFQHWLRERYGEIGVLNARWGTAFWGHTFRSFDEVPAPREIRTGHSPSLLLDFRRFTSDALREHYLAERAVLRQVTPEVPVTTNLMIQRGGGALDHRRWAPHMDLVSNDHYTMGHDQDRHQDIGLSADRTRGVAGGAPWLLMEHATSAVSWQGVNRAKQPGEMLRDSLSHVARGSEGAMFFQWRQSRAGAEQFHSAMVPHAGRDTAVFREVAELGRILRECAEIRGSRVPRGDVAVLWDAEAVWAYEQGPVPTDRLAFPGPVRDVHAVLTRSHLAVDVAHPEDSLDGYAVVVASMLFMMSAASTTNLSEFVARGGLLIVLPMTGIVDDANVVLPGASPGALRELLGADIEQMLPLLGESATIGPWSARHLVERVRVHGATVVSRFSSGPCAGAPAIVENVHGDGTARYIAWDPTPEALDALVCAPAIAAGAAPLTSAPPDVEVVRRVGDNGAWTFLINWGDDARVEAEGFDLVSGRPFDGALPAGFVAVLRESRAV